MASPERLEKYQDFITVHSTDGAYDPRKGLEGLLSIVSPDPKGVVLASMEEGRIYFTPYDLHNQTLNFLENLGLSKDIFPITLFPTWRYCERSKDGQVVEGSLVKIGSVVKQAYYDTAAGLQTGFIRSEAGRDLGIPAVQQVTEFVFKARSSHIPHRFDSMLRILGVASSFPGRRRPLAVFDVISYLTTHKGKHRQVDIAAGLQTYSRGQLALVLSSLGNCGLINYLSAARETEGKPKKGWSVYLLEITKEQLENIDISNLYQQIKREKTFYNSSDFSKVIDYIRGHPNEEYERNSLSEKLSINIQNISSILSWLQSKDYLKLPDYGFKGGKVSSQASANDLTVLFYDLVCLPLKGMAENLSTVPIRAFDKEKLAIFLGNYQEERSQLGLQGGEEVRVTLLTVLSKSKGDEMKRSYIEELYNQQSDRYLKSNSLGNHLRFLIKQGLIEQTRPGFYRLLS